MRKKDNYETIEKQYTIKFNKIDVIFASLCFVIFVGMCEYFYRQSIRYAGGYRSDLRHYIGNKDNPPGMDPIRGIRWILGNLYAINHSTWEDAIFMALLVIFTIAMNYYVIKYFTGNVGYKRWTFQLASLAALFTGPIAIPGAWEFFYKNTFSKYAWHSPTQVMMVAFSLLSVLLFFKIYDSYYEKISVKLWIALAISFFLSAWAKPSFIMMFFPVMAALLIIEFFTRRDADIKKRFFAALGFGTTAFPACVYFLILKYDVYGGDSHSSVVTDAGGLAETLSSEVLLELLLGVTFPLFVLLFNLKSLKNIKVSLFWIAFLVSYVEGKIFGETGIRANHGNFCWGRKMGIYLLFIVSIAQFMRNYKDEKFLAEKPNLRKFYFIAGMALLLMHWASAMFYLYHLFMGGYYYV